MVFRTTRFRFVLATALSFFIASAFSQPARDPISDAVGSSAGEFRVDESGSATYAIPLYVLPGTAGTAPSLTLAYSSNSGEGALGKGWNLSGNSSISRCRATRESGDFLDAGEQPIDGYPDPINFSLTDKFCLDGQRLLPELTANGTVVANVFRLELDAFTRVTAIYDATPANGPRAFRVQRRDGTTGWYGDFNGCALSAGLCSLTRVAANRPDAYLYANTLDAAGNVIQRNEASAWAMNRMIDSNGNYIDYRYLNDPDKSELLLDRVEYTGFARYSNAAGTHAAVAPYASIVMQYSDINAVNWRTGYSGGSRFVRSKRLENVTSFFGSNPVRFYSLSYQSSVSGSGSDLLTSFLECRDSTQAVCLRPTTFIWSAAQTTATLEKTASSTGLGDLVDSKFGDVDGDGRTELVWVRNTSGQCPSSAVQISKATKDATGRVVIGQPINSICTGWDSTPGGDTFVGLFWQLLDYNGDGRDDLMLAQRPDQFSGPTFWRVYLASATFVGFEATPSITTPIPVTIHTALSTSPGTMQFGDLNGDGVLDAVYPKQTNANPLTYRIFARYLERNTAGVFEYSPEYSIDYESAVPSYIVCGDCLLRRFAKTGQNLRDINGDGRADLLMTVAAGENPMRIPELFRNQKIWMSIASRVEGSASLSMKFITGTGSDLNASDAAPQVEGEAADFNGDGLSDLLYCYKPNPSISNELCTSYLGTGLRGAKAYRQIGVPFDQRSDRHLIDINNDGRTDVIFRPGADITDGAYQVLYANSEGALDGFASPMPGCTLSSCAATAFEHGSSFFMDLDGDASLDFLALQSPPNINDNIRTATSAVSSQFAPKDVIVQIGNGYGAQTNIDYLPLTNRDIYRRDQNSRNTLVYGRKSPVQDLLMPMYVVSKVTSSAPTQTNPNALSTLNYRYVGAKVQGGGRGFLGFREVVTFDGNYDGSGAQNCGPGPDDLPHGECVHVQPSLSLHRRAVSVDELRRRWPLCADNLPGRWARFG